MMRFLHTRKVPLVMAAAALASTVSGCDLGEPPRSFPGLAVIGTGDVNGDDNLDVAGLEPINLP